MRLAAQMFTVRELVNDEASLRRVLSRLCEIGYTAVQVSGISAVSYAVIKKELDTLGMVCCVTHENLSDILNNQNLIASRLSELGCTATAVGHPGPTPLNSMEDIIVFAEQLNKAGQKLFDKSCLLAYHNHALEFRKVNEKPILQWIYDLTDPLYFQSELDTYWVQAGGANPIDWINKLKGRLPLLHVKDFGIDSSGAMRFCEIGRGNLNWKGIILAAEKSMTEWIIVEQDDHWENNDPLESLATSYSFLSKEFGLI